MPKKLEVRNLIKKVMADVGAENQGEFSKILGFRPSTVSAWMTGSALPSPDAWMALGTKARNAEDALFCYEQAGLTKDAILSASRKLVGGNLAPVSGAVVYVPRLGEKRGEAGLPVPAEFVPNRNSTFYMRVEGHLLYGGDILVIDLAGSEGQSLMPFIDQVVAVQMKDEDEQEWPSPESGNVVMGRLVVVADIPRKPIGPWWASLYPLGGSFQREIWPLGSYTAPSGLSFREAERKAIESIRLSADSRIIGRVVAYFSGGQRWVHDDLDDIVA